LSGRGLCDELITHPEESYRLCCVVVCDLETSRMGAPYIYDISHLRVKILYFCVCFLYCNRLVHRDFLITLYITMYVFEEILPVFNNFLFTLQFTALCDIYRCYSHNSVTVRYLNCTKPPPTLKYSFCSDNTKVRIICGFPSILIHPFPTQPKIMLEVFAWTQRIPDTILNSMQPAGPPPPWPQSMCFRYTRTRQDKVLQIGTMSQNGEEFYLKKRQHAVTSYIPGLWLQGH